MGWKVISPLFSFGRLPKGVSALAQADGPARVYVFRADWRGAVSSAAATEHVLRAFGSVSAFNDYFGGHMTFGRMFNSHEFLGVWGHRNASRFRRILREKVGELEIVHAKPPARHSGSTVLGRRLTTPERRKAENSFRTND
jgi:hypothetical protein